VEGQDSLHLDQSAERVGVHAYQGAIYLEEATADDWCFLVMERSHLYFDEFFDNFKENSRSEYRKLTKTEKRWLSERDCPVVRVAVPKGGMVLWDSRLVHAGAPPVFGRDNVGRWRYVSFVCMTPAQWASATDVGKKVDGFRKLQCSSHWPSQRVKFFQSGKPTAQDITKLPAEAMTTEAKQLVGEIAYNYHDDTPNGPADQQWA